MNFAAARNRFAAPAISAGVTAAVLVGILFIQRAREAWPFSSATPPPALIAPPAATPSKRASATDRVPIEVAAATVAALDIRLEVVGQEAMAQSVRAVATVVPDESRISQVHTRVSGWIEQLDVNTTGEMVRAGQPLARIFSQELLASQAEYLAARRTTAALGITSVVVASGRTRLGVLGMSPADIDAIEQTGEPKRLVTVVAPRTGVVVDRGITVGTSVDPSTTLLTIADLSRVWIFAEVPEANVSALRVGTRAELDFPASGRPAFAARIDFVYPMLTERTRTLRVRFSAANAGGALRPGLYGTAVFEGTGQQVITVPRDAVVNTGVQQHVFVATGDRFEPRTVTLGLQLADRVEVRSGLAVGERIVVSGVFLLDSESRLRATGGAGSHAHAASGNSTGAADKPMVMPAVPATVPPMVPPVRRD